LSRAVITHLYDEDDRRVEKDSVRDLKSKGRATVDGSMTRTRAHIAGAFGVAVLVAGASGCGGSTSSSTPKDGGAGTTGADASTGDAPTESSMDSSMDSSRDAASAETGAVDGETGDVSATDAACGCLAHGDWNVANISPCFFMNGTAATVSGAISTVYDGQTAMCPLDDTAAPQAPWSTDTFETDCAGHYRLCFSLRAGDATNPKPTDCLVAVSCAESDYATSDVTQAWPPLPSWITTGAETTCAQTMAATGGYGIMTATGTPTGCGAVTKAFAIFTYCPLTCIPPACTCQSMGTGVF
jgi:hypothetical protein